MPPEELQFIMIAYIAIINLFAFSLMGIDKNRAKAHLWRISEAALFLSALAGGSVGSFCGMWVFHHKTKHWYFVMGIPLVLLVQILACLWFCQNVAGYWP